MRIAFQLRIFFLETVKLDPSARVEVPNLIGSEDL